MKCVAGAEMPTEGSIRFAGQNITALSPTERARAGMSLKFQITSVLPSLTLYDNILLALQAQSSLLDLLLSRTRGGFTRSSHDLADQFRLADRAQHAASTLSHGQQQWLEIAMSLACKPRLLLLDEPTAGMSLEERRITGELLAADQAALFAGHRRARPGFHPRHLRSTDRARPGPRAGKRHCR